MLAVFIVLGLLAASTAGLFMWRVNTWRVMSGDLVCELEARKQCPFPLVYDPAETSGLPAPVRRYFETVLRPGQPLIAAVALEHEGEINLGGERPNWKPFTSLQRVTTCPPGFDWFARVPLMSGIASGIAAEVHDAFVGGRGILRVRVAGAVSLVDLTGTADINKGELMRYLAEGAWYPTALLPSQGVVWEAVDATSARATLEMDGTQVSMLFRFAASGLIESVWAKDRPMMEKQGVRSMPWEGRWTGVIEVNGMRVPREGEVAWLLPTGRRPYWWGRVTHVRYAFSDDWLPSTGESESSG